MKFKYVPTVCIPYNDKDDKICFDINGYFETDNKELIEFLKNYKGVEIVKEERRRGRPSREVKEEMEEVKEETEEDKEE